MPMRGVGLTLKQLKEMQDGNELDLDMQELTIVPVMLLQQLKHKPTVLNLSLNLLQTLGDDFTQLTFLVKLDLSQNQLTSLPDNFGKLKALQHLDLYKNNLTTLPVSLGSCKQLRWLDVKDNPLDDNIAKIAGQCLDAKQCQAAANKVVRYLSEKTSEDERRKQKSLKIEREREAEERAAEELEHKKHKESKRQEKERKRREKAELNHQKQVLLNENMKKKTANQVNGDTKPRGQKGMTKSGKSGWIACFFRLILTLAKWTFVSAVLLTLASAFVLLTNCNRKEVFIPQSKKLCNELYAWAKEGGPKPSMPAIEATAIGVKSLADAGLDNCYQLAKRYEIDTALHKAHVFAEDAWKLTRTKSQPYIDKVVPTMEWLWKEVKCAASCAWNHTVQWTRLTLQYIFQAVQYTIDFLQDFVNNYPVYWEKIKFYWNNMK